uniref:Uncharacterized protein n=1 Tax=Capra hircus TaxID=9925 RepID=A0A8C2NKU9_CAPHI
MADPRVRQIKIKTGVVKRLLKKQVNLAANLSNPSSLASSFLHTFPPCVDIFHQRNDKAKGRMDSLRKLLPLRLISRALHCALLETVVVKAVRRQDE